MLSNSKIQFEADHVLSLKAKRTLWQAGKSQNTSDAHVTSVGVYVDPVLDYTCIDAHIEFFVTRDPSSEQLCHNQCHKST